MPNEDGQVTDENSLAPEGKLRILKEDATNGDVSIVGDFDYDLGRAKYLELVKFEQQHFFICNEHCVIDFALLEELRTSETASANGWAFVNISNHSGDEVRFMLHRYETVLLNFDGEGTPVNKKHHALWVKRGDEVAPGLCGCVTSSDLNKPYSHEMRRILDCPMIPELQSLLRERVGVIPQGGEV